MDVLKLGWERVKGVPLYLYTHLLEEEVVSEVVEHHGVGGVDGVGL